MTAIYIERVRSWWSTLSPRERVLVGTLGALLALVVLVYGIVKPLQAARAQALADIRTFETLNARVRAAPALGPSGPPPRTGAPDAIVSTSASTSGVVAQLQPIAGGVRATVASAGYDAVLAWLADLARTSSLTVTRVELQPGQAPGQVSAVVEFRG